LAFNVATKKFMKTFLGQQGRRATIMAIVAISAAAVLWPPLHEWLKVK